MSDEFNVGTELFAAWLLALMLAGLVVAMYYFTVVRVPAKPMFEKFTRLMTLSPCAQAKIDSWLAKGKSEGRKIAVRIPVVGKFLFPSDSTDLQPLTHPEVHVKSPTVIGAPLEDEATTAEPLFQIN